MEEINGNAMEIDDNPQTAEESEEDEDDDDEGEDNEEVDEELRLKIREALGNAAINGEEEDSDEEEFLDDDQMEAFDEKLAEIFRQRKEIKSAKKG